MDLAETYWRDEPAPAIITAEPLYSRAGFPLSLSLPLSPSLSLSLSQTTGMYVSASLCYLGNAVRELKGPKHHK